MRCSGCRRELEVGDEYIEDSASGFLRSMGDEVETDPALDALVAQVLGGTSEGKIVYCEDCTQEGGDYLFDTVYGDEDVG